MITIVADELGSTDTALSSDDAEPHDLGFNSLSDAELLLRTQLLVRDAQRLSAELYIQTERLNNAIDVFSQAYIRPLRPQDIHGEDHEDDSPAS